MKTSKSKFLNFSKKYPLFKNFYYFYNIYIRNYRFLKNGSQFGEEKFIVSNKNIIKKIKMLKQRIFFNKIKKFRF